MTIPRPARRLLSLAVCSALITFTATTARADGSRRDAHASDDERRRCESPANVALPSRPGDAPGWQALAAKFAPVEGAQREELIAHALGAGNLPDFLRRLRPVVLQGTLATGRLVRIVACVMPDYLSIGSDRDHMLMPMALENAVTLARRFGFVLPTRRLVDAIYAQADARLQPQPLPAGDAMRSTAYLQVHDRMIRAQRLDAHAPDGVLASGHKKDIVVTPALWRQPGQIAIYGWHRNDGRPIQPLSTVHGARYADYSHGVRLVSATAFVDGAARSMFELLADPLYAPLLSDEGTLPGLQAWMDAGGRMIASR